MEVATKTGARGRPRAFSLGELRVIDNGDALCHRQVQARCYAERGKQRLLDWAGEEPTGYAICVLEALGRIDDEALFRRAASWYLLHGEDLTAKRAAKRINHMRGVGSRTNRNPVALYERVLAIIDDHRAMYPDTRYDEIQQATVMALTVVRKTWSYIP